MKQKKTGTKEWAKRNINIADGCKHDCRYCYARHLKVNRFHQVEDWTDERVIMSKVDKHYSAVKVKEEGVADYMFPSTHDITPDILPHYLTVIKKVLAKGNTVVIVSKPHLECIEALARELEPWKKQVLFRFTITSNNNELLKYWEPNAPLFEERLASLKLCHENGYATSVSIEPALDITTTVDLVDILKPYVTEKIWIGIMKGVRLRVEVRTDEDRMQVANLLERQKDDNVLKLYARLASYAIVRFKDKTMGIIENKVAWKDSIRHVVSEHRAKHGMQGDEAESAP